MCQKKDCTNHNKIAGLSAGIVCESCIHEEHWRMDYYQRALPAAPDPRRVAALIEEMFEKFDNWGLTPVISGRWKLHGDLDGHRFSFVRDGIIEAMEAALAWGDAVAGDYPQPVAPPVQDPAPPWDTKKHGTGPLTGDY